MDKNCYKCYQKGKKKLSFKNSKGVQNLIKQLSEVQMDLKAASEIVLGMALLQG